MESWIASMLDHTAARDAARGWSRPLTFTNWLTLDPLDHRQWEPLPAEDLVSVDATHIAATKAWPGGFFVSYHAYPYYPRLHVADAVVPELQAAERRRGRPLRRLLARAEITPRRSGSDGHGVRRSELPRDGPQRSSGPRSG
jgi:hypothetical protein